MKDSDFFWLVGILEGEGTFLKGPPSAQNRVAICLEMTDEDVVAKVAKLLGVKYHKTTNRNPEKWKDSFRLAVVCKSAYELMKTLKPYMGNRRQRQIEVAMSSWKEKDKGKLFGRAEEILDGLRQGKTHREIAETLGVDRSAISHYLIRSGRQPVLIKGRRKRIRAERRILDNLDWPKETSYIPPGRCR